MKKGLVSVTGPLADGMMAVRAGQHLSVNIKKREVLLRETDDAQGADGGPGASGAVAPVGLGAANTKSDGEGEGDGRVDGDGEGAAAGAIRGGNSSGSRGASGSSAVRGSSYATAPQASRGWSAALVAGDLDSILADAERKGLHRTLREASSEDLAALADAARYRRRNEIARRALLAERSRFSHSSRASDAAFLLGRLEEGSPHGEGRALEWYD